MLKYYGYFYFGAKRLLKYCSYLHFYENVYKFIQKNSDIFILKQKRSNLMGIIMVYSFLWKNNRICPKYDDKHLYVKDTYDGNKNSIFVFIQKQLR